MNDLEETLLKALVAATPGIGQWIAGLIDGEPQDQAQTRRVRDVIPERSASQAVADDLRAHREG